MSVDLQSVSLAQWFDEVEQHKCGYCKNPRGSVSFGMMTESLTVEEYQDLIDRGWRRSGKYCYKPTMEKTCCPQYTIRCNASIFSLNKSHRKIIKKFNKFVTNGILHKNQSENVYNQEDSVNEYPEQKNQRKNEIDLSQVKVNNVKPSKNVENSSIDNPNHKISTENINVDNGQKSTEEMLIGSTNYLQGEPSERNKSYEAGLGADPTKPPCKKAKLLRLELRKQKLLQKSSIENKQDLQSSRDNSKTKVQKSLSQFLEETTSNDKHKFKLTLVPTGYECEEWERTKDTEFELYKKYQMLVHNDPEEKLSMGNFCRFLVNSPLKPKEFSSDIDGPGYGSFHQQYWLDDKLVAVGVIDILPSCVSSVYFFYDPDYRDLTLGTYGSLREIQLVQNLSNKLPDLHYYYMGFYIHSCPKMRYKGKLVPSDLLCPETYVWVPIEKCLPKLDISKYSRLNSDPVALDRNACSPSDLNKIQIIVNYKMMTAKDFVRHFDGDEEIFKNLGKLVGKRSASSIIFWIE